MGGLAICWFLFLIQSESKLSFCLLKTVERQIYIKQTRRHTDVQSDTPQCLVEACPPFFWRVCERGKGISSFVSVLARPLSDRRLRCAQVCSALRGTLRNANTTVPTFKGRLTHMHARTRQACTHLCLYAHKHTCTLMRAPDKLSHLRVHTQKLALPFTALLTLTATANTNLFTHTQTQQFGLLCVGHRCCNISGTVDLAGFHFLGHMGEHCTLGYAFRPLCLRSVD